MASFDVKDSKAVAQRIESAVEHSARRAIYSTAIRLVGYIQTDVIPGTTPQPVDRAAYRAGWRHTPTIDGAEVYNIMPYAPIIEWGAKSENVKVGKKMIDALTSWVLRKGIVGKEGKSKDDAHAAARSMAWAIAMKMKKNGIFNKGKGLRVLERALKMLPQFFAEEWRREGEKKES